MAQVNLLGDFWNPQAPKLDPNTGQYSTPDPSQLQPLPVSNPFGGEQEAETKRQLAAFRDQAKAQGFRADEGDVEAYAQMRRGIGSLAPQVPNQFDDPYTNQLESIAKAQMGQVRSNPGLDSLMQFLNQRFQELSTQPGYSPAEQSLLRTQAIEPIEADRQAAIQRANERTAARNVLPSSGIAELDIRDIERAADQRRTVAGRDLAIAGLNRRDADLNQALDIGQLLGLRIPQSQRGEELALGNLLYQLPRTAMLDALGVVNGSPSSNDAFTQALQLLQQQQQTDQFNNKQNAAIWSQLGQVLAGIFR